MIHVFTSSAPNYLGKVRVLCESLREHCPGVVIHWLVADSPSPDLVPDLTHEPFDSVLFATDLKTSENRAWLFQHSIVELSTAVKPAGALQFLEQGDCETLLYFDPDIVLFSPIDDLLSELKNRSLVLTPHQLKPESDPGAFFHELDSLRYGIFNLGFLGLTRCPEAIRFLTWWRDRCLLNCAGDWMAGVFTDQKWANFVPVFFDNVGIVKNPRFNVAPWNISQRDLRGTFDEGFTVDGMPLGFYHFTGFDSGAHQQHVDSLKGKNRSAAMLIDWYRLRSRALTPAPPSEWRLGRYENGEPIEDHHRKIYRERLDLQRVFTNPYEVDETKLTYREWLRRTGPSEFPDLFEGRPS